MISVQLKGLAHRHLCTGQPVAKKMNKRVDPPLSEIRHPGLCADSVLADVVKTCL